jgi:hypothetical protein
LALATLELIFPEQSEFLAQQDSVYQLFRYLREFGCFQRQFLFDFVWLPSTNTNLAMSIPTAQEKDQPERLFWKVMLK